MPFYTEGQDPTSPDLRQSNVAPDPDQFAGSPISTVAGAAFKQTNSVGMVIDALANQSPVGAYDPTHNAYNMIKGTKYEDHAEQFISSPNEAYTRWLMGRFDTEDNDRRALANSGKSGTALMLATGLLDPLMVIPGVGAADKFVTGGKIAKGIAEGAEIGAVQSLGQAAIAHATKPDRTFSEDVSEFSANTLLMGIMGGAHGMLSASERAAAADGIKSTAQDMRDLAAGKQLSSSGLPSAVGAAETDTRILNQPNVLKNIPYVGDKLASGLDYMSPTGRVFGGPSIEGRRALADLVETPRTFDENLAGQTTTLGGVAPIDRMVKTQSRQMMLDAHDAITKEFMDYRYGDNVPKFADAKTAINDLISKTDGKMTFSEFQDAVSDSMRNGDTHEIPQVQNVAKALRDKVLNPIQDLAQKTIGPDGKPLLAEDLSPPAGDASFFPRRYKQDKISADRPVFKDKVTNWLAGEQANKAAIKDRLSGLNDDLSSNIERSKDINNQLNVLDRQSKVTQARVSERGMSANASSARVDTLATRSGDIRETLSQLDEFMSTMKQERSGPDGAAKLKELQGYYAQLQNELKDISAAEAKRLDKSDIDSMFQGDALLGAQMHLGTRSRGENTEKFASYIKKIGGIKDDGGDLLSMIGRSKKAKATGIINQSGVQIDDLAQRLSEEFSQLKGEKLSPDEIRDAINGSLNGSEPEWFKNEFADGKGNARAFADELDHLLEGYRPKNMAELAQAVIDKTAGDSAWQKRMRERFDAANEAGGVGGAIEAHKQAMSDLSAIVDKASGKKIATTKQLQIAEARSKEAGIAGNRDEKRASILDERQQRQQKIIDDLQAEAHRHSVEHDILRSKIEDELRKWSGNSSAEAMSALKIRDAKTPANGERSVAADNPVDRAVKRILNSDRDMSRQELSSRADEIIDRILHSPDGKLDYDQKSASTGFGSSGDQLRGSLNSRQFAIPSDQIKDYLHTDLAHVLSDHIRKSLPDIYLTQRFGDVNMTSQMRKINEEFAKMADTAANEKARVKLESTRQRTIEDLASMRDRVRGTFGVAQDPFMRKANRVAKVFLGWNSLTSLGTSAINRGNDIANGVFRYGLGQTFKAAWAPYLASLVGASEVAKLSRREAKAMGVGVDTILGHMSHNLSDTFDNYLAGSKLERGLAWANDKSMLLNLHGPWTDGAKTMWNTVASDRYLEGARRFAEGAQTKADIRDFASSNITPQMAKRIWESHSNSGATPIDGIHIPNVADWADKDAQQSFTNAMAREGDINVITPGQEKPLWMSSPIGSLVGQFKSFVAGANERILIANLQRADKNVLQGLFSSLGAGMLSYAAYKMVSGGEISERPQDWIKEGISRAALLGWGTELNAYSAKLTGGKADLFRAIGADRPLSRHEQQSALAEMLGPTWSKLDQASQIIGDVSRGTETGHTTHVARQLIPLQNWMLIRRMLDQVEDGANSAMGLKPIDRSGKHWPSGVKAP